MQNCETSPILFQFENYPCIVGATARSRAVKAAVCPFEQSAGRSATTNEIPQNAETMTIRCDSENRASILSPPLIGGAIQEAIAGLDDRSTRRIAGDSRRFERKNPLIIGRRFGTSAV